MTRAQYLQFRGGTAAQWTTANPTLGAREPGFETDTGKFKIGDGTTAWTSLAYLTSGTGGAGTVTIASTAPLPGGIAAAGTTGQVSDAGHIHPRQAITASTVSGYKGWSMDEAFGMGGNTALLGSSGVQLAAIVVEQDTIISNLVMYLGVAGTVTTAGQCFAAIFTSTGSQLAVTADISGQMTSVGKKTFPMASPTATIPGGTIIYGALLINGMGTSPQFGRQGMPGVMVPFQRFGTIAGTANATTMPGSFTPAANVAPTSQFWMAIT